MNPDQYINCALQDGPVEENIKNDGQLVVGDLIAGALFDFMGMLTTQDEETHLSAHHDASVAVKMIQRFAEKRGLNLDEAMVSDWTYAISKKIAD